MSIWRKEDSFFFNIFIDDPPQEFWPKGRAINLLPSACNKDRTGIAAKLTLDTVVKGVDERLKKGPIILFEKEFFEAGEKLLDELLFLFCHFGAGECQWPRNPSSAFVLSFCSSVNPLRGGFWMSASETTEGALDPSPGFRSRVRQVVCMSFNSHRSLHGLILFLSWDQSDSLANSLQVEPVLIWGPFQVTFWSSISLISFLQVASFYVWRIIPPYELESK